MSPSTTTRHADGYVLNVSAPRRPVLLNAADAGEAVAEVVPDFTHARDYPLVCFVGFQDGAITHLALGRRGHYRAATKQKTLYLNDLTRLSVPVLHSTVLAKIPKRFHPHVENRFGQGGLLPPGSFVSVIEAIRDLVPESNAILERFSARRQAEIAGLSTHVRRALAYQKETVATALYLAGIPTAELQVWRPRVAEQPVRSFLDGLLQARLREDQMVIHDLQTFPGFEVVRTMQHATAVFTNKSVTLTVVMANRHPLETQIGADLIYRNETYGAFVIVQYKAMEDAAGAPRFRLPNTQLTAELERMEKCWAELRNGEPDGSLGAFRLKDNPFFLKLCPRITFAPDDAGLIRGMYIPLEYWRRLEADSCIEGPHEGRGVTFHNVGRHLNNTEFAQLVAGGWIGTSGSQTAILDAVIQEIVGTGRAVTIAVKRNLTHEERSAQLEAIELKEMGAEALENDEQL